MTVPELQAATDRGERWAMVGCCEPYACARLEAAGVRVVLVDPAGVGCPVGRSAASSVTIDELVSATRGVVRNTVSSLVVAALPRTVNLSDAGRTVTDAVRVLKEGGARAVTLRDGRGLGPTVETLASAGIPVMVHVHAEHHDTVIDLHAAHRRGSRRPADDRLLDASIAFERAGACAVIVECASDRTTAELGAALRIPVVGTDGGRGGDARLVPWQDIVGLAADDEPGRRGSYAAVGEQIEDAVSQFVHDVGTGRSSGADRQR